MLRWVGDEPPWLSATERGVLAAEARYSRQRVVTEGDSLSSSHPDMPGWRFIGGRFGYFGPAGPRGPEGSIDLPMVRCSWGEFPEVFSVMGFEELRCLWRRWTREEAVLYSEVRAVAAGRFGDEPSEADRVALMRYSCSRVFLFRGWLFERLNDSTPSGTVSPGGVEYEGSIEPAGD